MLRHDVCLQLAAAHALCSSVRWLPASLYDVIWLLQFLIHRTFVRVYLFMCEHGVISR